MRTLRFASVTIGALLVAGCSSGASPSTAAGTPTGGPTATEAPASGPTDSQEPASTSAAEIVIPKPSGDLTVKIGQPSENSFYSLGILLTVDRLNADGWSVENVEFTQTQLNTQAISDGTVQFSNAQVLEATRAVELGADVDWVMENNRGEFVLIAKNEINECQDLDGMRFGIHGEASTTSVAAVNYLRDECGINPEVLVIPGGDNRVIALQNDQLDGTIAQVADWLTLETAAPGEFHLLDTGSLFDTSGTSIWVNGEWAAANEDVAVAFAAELLKSFRMLHEDRELIAEIASKYLPEMSAEQMDETAETYIEVVKAWPPDGGSIDIVESSVEIFREQGEITQDIDVQGLVSPIRDPALELVGQ